MKKVIPGIHSNKKGQALFTAIQLFAMVLLAGLPPFKLFAQAPNISYSGPQSYTSGTAITALTPTNTGGSIPAVAQRAVSTFAGSGAAGSANGKGTAATFHFSQGFITVDKNGNVYVADDVNYLIRKITPAGVVSTLAGSGASGSANGTGAAASFIAPHGIITDPAGNVYVADFNRIRKITPAGVVTTFVTITNSNADLTGLTIDAAGNLYAADPNNGIIYKITPAGTVTNVISDINNSALRLLFGLTIDGAGNLYGCSTYTNVIIKVTQAGVLTTIAGNSQVSGSANGTGSLASFNEPNGIAADASGNFYLADEGNNLIRKMTPGGVVTTYAGVLAGGFTNSTLAASKFSFPTSIYFGPSGIMYIADANNNVIRKISTTGYTVSPALPAGLSINPNTGTIGGTPTAASPATNYTITAYNSGGSGVAAVNIKVTSVSANANLSAFKPGNGTLSPGFSSATTSYTSSVANAVASITITPTAADATATIKVQGVTVASGATSGAIALSAGANTINTVVTAADGKTTKTYTLTVTRLPAAVATLSAFKPGNGTLAPAFNASTTSYACSVANTVTAITITPTATSPVATITVNGVAVASGSTSGAVALSAGPNTITTVVTAQDGKTKKTYTLTVTRLPSANANLSSFKPSKGTISPGFSSGTTSYTSSVANAVSSITINPTAADATATIKINGTAVASGSPSGALALAVGANTINTVVTAQNGTTTKSYTLTVTRVAGGADSFDAGISVTKPTEAPSLNDDMVSLHQGVSPNGDGVNDFLTIENISQYPDNKLSIMNRNGQLIFEAKGYDNSSKVFDGHSSKNGQMQLPGTYFYQLDYTVKGITRHKTGFIVLKY